MSDETTKQNAVPAEGAQKQAPDLSQDEMGKVVGGAANAFLQIDGIDGESQGDNHKDWIEVLSFNHSVTQTKP